MVQTPSKSISFDEFITCYPDSPGRYELHDGTIIEMPKPTGQHSNVAGFLMAELILTIVEMGRRGIWTIPREAIIKSSDEKSGYEPDVIVTDQNAIAAEPRWQSESILQNAESIKLVVEVVSTNWRDDYFKKRADYEEMGIPEYWIVDYVALGGRNFLGNPKVPTLSVHQLVEGEYQVSQFRHNETIISPTFPNFNPTARQIFQAV